MKKLVCFIMALTLFNACQKKEEQRYFSDSPEIESSKKLVGYFASYDYEGMKSIYSDTVKIYDNSVEPITIDQMINDFKESEGYVEWMKVKDSAEYEMVITKDNETWVNCWYVVAFKFKDHDKEFLMPSHATFQFKDGRIVEEHSFYNTLEIYREMENFYASNDTITTN
jgi:hypothetical protein